jgi:hypothetical protein
MPLFPVIDIEALVQENDKTRIDVSKSFASGTTAVTGLSVKPSKSVNAIDVFADGFLDWQYPFTVEIDAANNKINFKEGVGAELTATLTDGEYTLSALAAEIQTKMRAAGTLIYELSVSAVNEITIAAPGLFSLLTVSGTNADLNPLAVLGFSADSVPAIGDLVSSYKGKKVERITKKITLTVTNAVPLSTSIIREIEVISEIADRLFSTDDRMRKHEPDIMKYLPEGRSTFKDVHRRAQTLILDWLDTEGFIDNFGVKLKLASFTDTEEVAEWSTMMAIRLVFEGVSNAIDDVFAKKAKKYEGLETFYRNRATVKVDLNQDGVADAVTERLDIRSARVMRR